MKESSLKGKLRRLGSTPEAIADNLKARGIKGTGSCYSCPIANFLAQSTKGIEYVSVGNSSTTVRVNGVWVNADLPRACSQFVTRFDSDRPSKRYGVLRAKNWKEVQACNPIQAQNKGDYDSQGVIV